MRFDALTLNNFRSRVGRIDALPQWVLMGILAGVFSGAIILLFHLATDALLIRLLPGNDNENFEGLSTAVRFVLPLIGSLLVISLFLMLEPQTRQVGITHVVERLGYHQGNLPWRNALVQFATGIISLVSGHSAGREGPAVHLGAAASSLTGQWLRLPNNALRTLVGCGTAAAISASFNTPIAGIIFAMEVVIMEYTAAGFVPVVIASVTAALVQQIALSTQSVFQVPAFQIQSLQEIPFILLMGLILGGCSVLFSRITIHASRFQREHMVLRLLLAGLITGAVATQLPQVMGLGYDTVNGILHGDESLHLLLVLALAKLLVTALAVGLGVPMGLIGPTLYIGAAAGGALGMLGALLAGETVSNPGFYAMLGMGAMMGAVLQAPLAALMALLEMTLNPNILFPGMVVIVTSTLVNRYFCRDGSIFHTLLLERGLDWRRTPLELDLERTTALTIARPISAAYPPTLEPAAAVNVLERNADWLLIAAGRPHNVALASRDLRDYLDQHPETGTIDLLAIPGQRLDLTTLDPRGTLKDALTAMNSQNVDGLTLLDYLGRPVGLLLREDINRHFMSQQSLQRAEPAMK